MPAKRLLKRLSLIACALIGVVALASHRAGAEHFDVLLHVQGAQAQADAFMDTTPPEGGVNPRPVVKIKVGESIRVNWRMASAFPHGTMKNVTIHFFVVREAALGQKPVPDPAGSAGIVDNSFDMDFAPKAASRGALRFKITEPGNYLVRVQSENTHQEHDHEHFAAIDLLVE